MTVGVLDTAIRRTPSPVYTDDRCWNCVSLLRASNSLIQLVMELTRDCISIRSSATWALLCPNGSGVVGGFAFGIVDSWFDEIFTLEYVDRYMKCEFDAMFAKFWRSYLCDVDSHLGILNVLVLPLRKSSLGCDWGNPIHHLYVWNCWMRGV